MIPDAYALANPEVAGNPVTAVTMYLANTSSLDAETGIPYFSVQNVGIWGPTNATYVPKGWMECGWTRYSTLEKKILTRGNVHHEPLPRGCEVELEVYDSNGNKSIVGISGTPDSTGPLTYWEVDRVVGEKFMPVIQLFSNSGTGTPTLHAWTLYGMVVPIRQDEIMLPLIMKTRTDDLTIGGAPHYLDILSEFLFLKQCEAGGIPVNVVVGGIDFTGYIDQIQVVPGKEGIWNDDRTFPESTVIVKLITLGPIGSSPTASTGSGDGS